MYTSGGASLTASKQTVESNGEGMTVLEMAAVGGGGGHDFGSERSAGGPARATFHTMYTSRLGGMVGKVKGTILGESRCLDWPPTIVCETSPEGRHVGNCGDFQLEHRPELH